MRALASSFVGVGSVLLGVALTGRGPAARAAKPEDVPPNCRAQVQTALVALEPILDRPSRKLARSAVGTLERAIADYAPPRLHAVEEGVLPKPTANARCPDGMASVGDRFCIDRYEGSLVEKAPDGSTRAHSPYAVPEDGHVYLARSVKDVIPQGYISAAQAEAACKAAGKRLCHPVEWRAACGGSEAYAYPYGPTRRAGVCRDRGATPMLTFHADTMKRGWGLLELNDARNNQLEDTVARTGASPDCVTDQGVYDMVGNLHEWTADPNGTFQGGYWLDTSQHGEGCAYRTVAHGFGYHDYSTGFRCCATPSR